MTDVYAALSGNGVLTLAAPRFVPLIGVNVTTFPPGATVRDVDSPRRVMKVGWVAPGRLATDPSWPSLTFFEKETWIEFEREMITFASPGIFCDRIRYHLEPGAVATLYVNDTGVPSVPNASLAPWDRSPTIIKLGGPGAVSGGGSATPFTYTVPTGKVLALVKAEIRLRRWTVASALSYAQADISIDGTQLCFVFFIDNTIGHEGFDDLYGGPLYLPAGTVITSSVSDPSTGGSLHYMMSLAGQLFDAS